MKIDLDDIERKARDLESCNTMGEYDPAVVIALIARIRELESELEGWRDEVVNDRTIREDPDRLTSILEKGAVIPMKIWYIEGEIAGVDQLAWFRQAYEQVRRMEAEEERQNRALICWHHLYRWPEIRRAAWAAYAKERYDFLMYLADHAGPDAVTHRAVLP